jgi:hypothetical protein
MLLEVFSQRYERAATLVTNKQILEGIGDSDRLKISRSEKDPCGV